ncbi:hypothetical protein LCGC14_1999960, partial [marine sediment metagenome]
MGISNLSMTLGDTAAEIVESPITAAKITAAMD